MSAPSVIVVTHNSMRWIDACLTSLASQQPPVGEILVVDNGSTDGTPEHVEANHPAATVVREANRGYGAGCNRGASRARGDVLVFLNPDTRLAPDAVLRLTEALAPGTLANPQILLMQRPELTNTRGLDLHHAGYGFVRGYLEPALPVGVPEEVPGLSGAAFAALRGDFERLGGFDENIFLYGEDVELSWRARAAGMRMVWVPAAVVWHSYEFTLSAGKLQNLEASRRYIVRRHWRRRDRLRFWPSLAVARALALAAGASVRSRSPAPAAVPRPVAYLHPPPAGIPAMAAWKVPLLDARMGRLARTALAVANAVFWLNHPRRR